MAVTGKGDFPFKSIWLIVPCQFYRGLTWADDDDAPKDVWSDFFFEAAAGGPTIVEADGSAAGIAASSVLAVAVWNTLHSATGLAADSVLGVALWNSVYAVSGLAADSVVGAALWLTGYSSLGLAAVSANSQVTAQSDGASVGAAADAIVAAALWNTLVASTGVAGDAVVSGATWLVPFSAAGLSTVSGQSESSTPAPVKRSARLHKIGRWNRRLPTVFGYNIGDIWG